MTDMTKTIQAQDTRAALRWRIQQIADEVGIKYDTAEIAAMRLYVAVWEAKQAGVYNPSVGYALEVKG